MQLVATFLTLMIWQDFVITERQAASEAAGPAFVVTDWQKQSADKADSLPYFVYFTAGAGCGPCNRMAASTIPKLKAAGFLVKTIHIDSDENTWGVDRGPEIWLCRDSQRFEDPIRGYVSADTLLQKLGLAGTQPGQAGTIWNRPGTCYESREAMIQHLMTGIHAGRSRSELDGMTDAQLSTLHEQDHRKAGDAVVNGMWVSRKRRR